MRGLLTLYMVGSNVLTGLVVPVHWFPGWMAALATATPFPSMLQAPVDVISGRVTGWHSVYNRCDTSDRGSRPCWCWAASSRLAPRADWWCKVAEVGRAPAPARLPGAGGLARALADQLPGELRPRPARLRRGRAAGGRGDLRHLPQRRRARRPRRRARRCSCSRWPTCRSPSPEWWSATSTSCRPTCARARSTRCCCAPCRCWRSWSRATSRCGGSGGLPSPSWCLSSPCRSPSTTGRRAPSPCSSSRRSPER